MLKDAFTQFEPLMPAMSIITGQMGAALAEPMAKIADKLMELVSNPQIEWVINAALTGLSWIIDRLADLIGFVNANLKPAIDGVVTAFWNVVNFFKNDVPRFFGELPGTIWNALCSFGKMIGDFFASLPGMAWTGLVRLGEMLAKFFTDLWEQVGTWITGGGADKKGWW